MERGKEREEKKVNKSNYLNTQKLNGNKWKMYRWYDMIDSSEENN